MQMQDMDSWTRDGIAGLQSVVLYSLPELDGEWDSQCLSARISPARTLGLGTALVHTASTARSMLAAAAALGA